MHLLIEPAINGAVYGLFAGAILGFVLEYRYCYFSEQTYRRKTRKEVALSHWIEDLESEAAYDVIYGSPSKQHCSIEELVREAEGGHNTRLVQNQVRI